MCFDYNLEGKKLWLATSFLITMTAVLMVSNVRYYSFKDINLKGKVPFLSVLVALSLLLLIAGDPPRVLFGGFLIYAISGPLAALKRMIFNRGEVLEDESESESKPVIKSETH